MSLKLNRRVALVGLAPYEVGIGRFVVASGTGANSGMSGSGTFEIVVDATTNQLMGTEDRSVHLPGGEGR